MPDIIEFKNAEMQIWVRTSSDPQFFEKYQIILTREQELGDNNRLVSLEEVFDYNSRAYSFFNQSFELKNFIRFSTLLLFNFREEIVNHPQKSFFSSDYGNNLSMHGVNVQGQYSDGIGVEIYVMSCPNSVNRFESLIKQVIINIKD